MINLRTKSLHSTKRTKNGQLIFLRLKLANRQIVLYNIAIYFIGTASESYPHGVNDIWFLEKVEN